MAFPENDLEDVHKLSRILGSHWQDTYADQKFINAFLLARGATELQNHQNLVEAGDLLGRITAPVYHTENWLEFRLTESDRTERPIKYGDGTVYGSQPVTGLVGTYGGSLTADEYVFPSPSGLVLSYLLQNQISEPSVTWHYGIDYVIDSDDGAVTFRTDPFADENLIATEIFENDTVIDREITLWFKRALIDRNHIYAHIGYVAGVENKSTQSYKNLLNAYLDAAVLGSAGHSIASFTSAALNVPLVKESSEIVENIYSTSDALVITTDANAYRFNPDDTATVSPGDVVYAGQFLTEAAQVYEMSSGAVPSGLLALGLENGFLTGYMHGVMFVDKTVDLVVEEDVQGKTKVSFELSGHPLDVEKFWDDTHTRGVDAGRTLAELMDLRGTPPPYEPNSSTLPSTINPLEFLISNLLRFNAYVIKVDISKATAGAFGFSQIGLLRRMMPPWTALFLVATATVSEDNLNLSAAGTTTSPGGGELLASFDGANPCEEQITGPSMVRERVRLSAVEGFCR